MIRRVASSVLAAVVVAAVLTGVAQSASAYQRNPSANIPPPAAATSGACLSSPYGTSCENTLIAALNHARAVMKEPAYALPSTFTSLAPRDQLMVLSDLDRQLYGLQAIRGYSSALVASAAAGVRNSADPPFVEANGVYPHSGGSNWFGASFAASPLLAYYDWMYDDGYGGGNADCTSPTATGCWGHRDGTLVNDPGNQVAFGDAYGTATNGTHSWAELYETFPPSAAISYTPTLITLSTHSLSTKGGTLTVAGFGFVGAVKVTVLGVAATITSATSRTLGVKVPAHVAGTGYVLVQVGSSSTTATSVSAFRYVA